MTAFQQAQIAQAKVGNDAGWEIDFHRLRANGTIDQDRVKSITSRDYYASIDVTLTEDLNGGSCTITIEGLTDEDFVAIQNAPAIKLYLYWRDTNSFAGYFTNLVGLNAGPRGEEIMQCLIAVLYVGKLSRRVGSRRYETVIEAKHLAFWRLNSETVAERFTAENFASALRMIRERTGVSFAIWGNAADGTMTPRPAGEAPGSEQVTFGRGLRYAEAVRRIANSLELALNRHGRKMILISDDTVHVGKRPIPYPEGEPLELTLECGLLQAEEDHTQDPDPFAGRRPSSPPAANQKKTYSLTLKGRPDLKVGRVVRFQPETLDEASTLPSIGQAVAGPLFGAFAGPFIPEMGGPLGSSGVLLYITSVRHTLSRTAGFVTIVKGVTITGTDDAAWDRRDDAPSAPVEGAPNPSADPAAAAAAQVRRIAAAARDSQRTLEVAEVRAAASGASGAVEPPSQTLTLWEGLVAPDGRANGARRLNIQRTEPTALGGVAYLSPFAWGKCGLVLPRYPGTRVALSYRNGRADDALDVGALWASGRGPVSEPGDWWLILPVDVANSQRSSIGDSDTPQEHTGKVTQDLIDAAGNRIIEVGELTIRVGKDQLGEAGSRPGAPSERGNITIQHTGGNSRIVMKQDGSIEIAGSNITLDAGTSGTITMKGNKVDVQVQDSMEVR